MDPISFQDYRAQNIGDKNKETIPLLSLGSLVYLSPLDSETPAYLCRYLGYITWKKHHLSGISFFPYLKYIFSEERWIPEEISTELLVISHDYLVDSEAKLELIIGDEGIISRMRGEDILDYQSAISSLKSIVPFHRRTQRQPFCRNR